MKLRSTLRTFLKRNFNRATCRSDNPAKNFSVDAMQGLLEFQFRGLSHGTS
ncbi:hypothetical protein PS712_03339 [Pseudomonas fluorescens]|uniref:Uncharacterized protein n=1 Tax=Pseudomonas fluorescens TaxID=294 RepID=A0A5E7CWR0_PSEFL|nr:hypothetical protein PS712_03339 [Pseudomonas fluorescens]